VQKALRNNYEIFDMWFVLLLYGIGVLIGLVAIDARPAARVGLALVWPIGPAAFVVTLAVLLAASLIAFPIVGAVVLAVALLWVVFT
jgi:hypothetical protein